MLDTALIVLGTARAFPPAAVETVLLRADLVAELLPAMEVGPIAELQRAAVGVPVPVYVPQLLDLAAHLSHAVPGHAEI